MTTVDIDCYESNSNEPCPIRGHGSSLISVGPVRSVYAGLAYREQPSDSRK